MTTSLDSHFCFWEGEYAFGLAKVTSAPPFLGMVSVWEGCRRQEGASDLLPPVSILHICSRALGRDSGLEGAIKGPLEKGEQLPPLMWSVSITLITNHLITGFPTNSN